MTLFSLAVLCKRCILGGRRPKGDERGRGLDPIVGRSDLYARVFDFHFLTPQLSLNGRVMGKVQHSEGRWRSTEPPTNGAHCFQLGPVADECGTITSNAHDDMLSHITSQGRVGKSACTVLQPHR